MTRTLLMTVIGLTVCAGSAHAQDEECPQDCEPSAMVGGCCPIGGGAASQDESKKEKKSKKSKKSKKVSVDETSAWLLDKLSVHASSFLTQNRYTGGSLDGQWSKSQATVEYAAPVRCVLQIDETYDSSNHDGWSKSENDYTVDLAHVGSVDIAAAVLDEEGDVDGGVHWMYSRSGFTHYVSLVAADGRKFPHRFMWNHETMETPGSMLVEESTVVLKVNGEEMAERIAKALRHLASECAEQAADEPF